MSDGYEPMEAVLAPAAMERVRRYAAESGVVLVKRQSMTELSGWRGVLFRELSRRHWRWLPSEIYYWLLDWLTDNGGWRPLRMREHG